METVMKLVSWVGVYYTRESKTEHTPLQKVAVMQVKAICQLPINIKRRSMVTDSTQLHYFYSHLVTGTLFSTENSTTSVKLVVIAMLHQTAMNSCETAETHRNNRRNRRNAVIVSQYVAFCQSKETEKRWVVLCRVELVPCGGKKLEVCCLAVWRN